MLSRGAPGVPLTLSNFDAQNRAIRPISIWGGTSSDMLGGGRWGWWIGQMGCPIDCAWALENHVGPCRIAPDRAVGTIIGAVRGRY